MSPFVGRFVPAFNWIAVTVLVGAAIGVYRAVATAVRNGYFDEPMRVLAGRVLEMGALDGAKSGLVVAAAGLLLFAVAWPICRLVFRDSPKTPLGAILAVPLIPLFAVVGYELNRKVLPSLLSIPSLLGNLALAVMAFLAWWWLLKWIARHREIIRSVAGNGIAAAVLGALVVIAVGLPVGSARLWKKEVDAQSPNVLVVLIDALRADRLGSYGYHRDTSPNLDKLANEGWRFTTAIAQAPWTKPSVASLVTGLYARQTSIGTDAWAEQGREGAVFVRSLAPEHLTLAEKLASEGFETAAFGHNNHLVVETGFAQGYLTYDWKQPPGDGLVYEIARRFKPRLPDDWINRHFFEWLDANDGRKFFAYLHTLEVHWPYRSPAPFAGMYLTKPPPENFNRTDFVSSTNERLKASSDKALDPDTLRAMSDAYDECIRHVDDDLGKLFQELARRGLYQNTLIIITADHGEEFMDHGLIGHGNTLYDELIRVPLIVKFPCPGAHCRPEVVTSPVESVDIFPTVMATVGLESPEHLVGGHLADKRDRAQAAFSEGSNLIAMRTPEWKIIYDELSDSGGLYDLRNDPGETSDLASRQSVLSNLLLTRLLDFSATRATNTAGHSSVIEADEKMLEGLRALGYVK